MPEPGHSSGTIDRAAQQWRSRRDQGAIESFAPEFRRVFSQTMDGSVAGGMAGLLIRICGIDAEPEVDRVFAAWIDRARESEEDLHQAALAVSQLSSALKLRPDRHAWLSGFAVSLLSRWAGAGDDKLTLSCWSALASASDDDLAGPGARRVLTRLADPGVAGRARQQLLLGLSPNRLTVEGGSRLLDATLRGSTADQASVFGVMVSSVATARAIPDERLYEWAGELDKIAGLPGSMSGLARSVRRGMTDHR
jgi:hypothetical protein